MVSLSPQSDSRSPLVLILLSLILILFLFGIFYLIFQRVLSSKEKPTPSSLVSQPPIVDLQSAVSDPRFLRLKSLAPIPQLESQIGRDNPFSAYQLIAPTPPQTSSPKKPKTK